MLCVIARCFRAIISCCVCCAVMWCVFDCLSVFTFICMRTCVGGCLFLCERVFRFMSSYVAFVHNDEQSFYTFAPCCVAYLYWSDSRFIVSHSVHCVCLTHMCVFSLLGAQWRSPLIHRCKSSSFSSAIFLHFFLSLSFQYNSNTSSIQPWNHPCIHPPTYTATTFAHMVLVVW